jgi:signal transduction histidine kinase/ActR/RegA family two-component response regulator
VRSNPTSAPPGDIVEGGTDTHHDRVVALLAGQSRALELIARNAPLSDVLDFLMRLIETQAPGLLCSVLLLEGDRLRHGAAPNLPEAYSRAVDGIVIGPAVGSCGTAAYTGKSVVVCDIATDPLWADFADVALAHGLRACWSTPILAANGGVIGTFALYYRETSSPHPDHVHLVELATHLAGIAIERRRQDEALAERARLLAEADRRKDECLALLAHELRNLLAPIITALEMMRGRRRTAAAGDRYSSVIERQVHVMTRLVDDLLDISRITRGAITLKKERTTALALIASAVETSRPLLDRLGHTLRILVPDEAIELDADPVRLAQVLSNLLNNSAKYTDPGGHVEVRAAREGGEVVLSVRDHGIGIHPEMIDRVFQLFVQAEGASAQAPGGLGIGLWLVKSLVELHGGRVEAKSEGLRRGTTVTVRLPAPTAPWPAAGPSGTPRVAQHELRQQPRRVLLVDDNVDAVETLADALRDEQIEVAVAHDGPGALSAAALCRPDAAVVDIGLPGMDGYELARHLRAACPGILRLVALTGHGQESDQIRARDAGFDVHLVKPADVDRILAAIADSGVAPSAPCGGGIGSRGGSGSFSAG